MSTAIIEQNYFPFVIAQNPSYNSYEVKFEGKPSEAVRAALKVLKMRWNPKKCVWYGFASESAIRSAIMGANIEAEKAEEEATSIVMPGYLGATAVYGSKSHKHLYGAELSKAIRQDLKAAGIKSTTKVQTYSGGQSITVTMQISASDYISEEEYITKYQVKGSCGWVNTPDGSQIHIEKYYSELTSAEEREEIRVYNAKREYAQAWETGHNYTRAHVPSGGYIANNNTSEWLQMLTEEAHQRIIKANNIIAAYRYDDSNSMVDYYNTNFYYDIELKNVDYK